jgi:hypothetical protein
MSTQALTVQAQNTTYFPVTQSIWKKAWNEEGNSLSKLCAKVACIVFPIIVAIAVVEGVLLVGRKVLQLCAKQKENNTPAKIGQPPAPQPVQPPIKVDLTAGSSQYDIVNNPADPMSRRPPACTFHALSGASGIAAGFEQCVQWIESQNAHPLSLMQRGFIIEGTGMYFATVTGHPNLTGGADLEDIKNTLPEFLIQKGLYFQNTNQDPQLIGIRTQAIVDHLFAAPEGKRINIAWIKNGNDESFSVICDKERAIVFDSHKKNIYLIRGKEQTRFFLNENLMPFAEMIEGMDGNAFSYSLGFFEQ